MPEFYFKFLYNFIEIALSHRCSSVNLLHIIRTPFPKNISEWLLLVIAMSLFSFFSHLVLTLFPFCCDASFLWNTFSTYYRNIWNFLKKIILKNNQALFPVHYCSRKSNYIGIRNKAFFFSFFKMQEFYKTGSFRCVCRNHFKRFKNVVAVYNTKHCIQYELYSVVTD